jgi:hypothetical protein
VVWVTQPPFWQTWLAPQVMHGAAFDPQAAVVLPGRQLPLLRQPVQQLPS